jgi:hypothetical protein
VLNANDCRNKNPNNIIQFEISLNFIIVVRRRNANYGTTRRPSHQKRNSQLPLLSCTGEPESGSPSPVALPACLPLIPAERHCHVIIDTTSSTCRKKPSQRTDESDGVLPSNVFMPTSSREIFFYQGYSLGPFHV